jgi:hypothetical protein
MTAPLVAMMILSPRGENLARLQFLILVTIKAGKRFLKLK